MYLRASWRNLPRPNKIHARLPFATGYVSAPITSRGDHVVFLLLFAADHVSPPITRRFRFFGTTSQPQSPRVNPTRGAPGYSESSHLIPYASLRFAADHVELHEVCGAANTHRLAGTNADDAPLS